VIRTRGRPWRSRPHRLLTALSIGVVAVGLLIPLTPLGSLFGFVLPPPGFYLFLIATVAAYLLLVEVAKHVYYQKAGRTH
jgi:Mg2+-importing ATPase